MLDWEAMAVTAAWDKARCQLVDMRAPCCDILERPSFFLIKEAANFNSPRIALQGVLQVKVSRNMSDDLKMQAIVCYYITAAVLL